MVYSAGLTIKITNNKTDKTGGEMKPAIDKGLATNNCMTLLVRNELN
jgi:hypothetical protein